MIGALVYLQLTSLKNAGRRRLQRLRQPRYLFATIVGLAYFYFFFFRQLASRGAHHGPPGMAPVNIGLAVGLSVAVLIMALRIVYTWIFSTQRAALAFTEAEVAFLFQAPVSRRVLVHFKLLKSQLRILFLALLFSLLSNRYRFLGGNVWTHAAGWWILLSTLELHGIGASFTRERLLNLGLNPMRRRVLLGGALALFGFITWWWLRRHLPTPPAIERTNVTAIFTSLQGVLALPPLSWILAPFRWILGPFFAPDGTAFLRALGPALLVLGVHYVWVIRSEVAFEEASIDLARKHAERVAAFRAGGWRGLRRPARRRREPFALHPRGLAPIAFLWKNLISAGPWFYPRNWLLISAAVLAVVAGLAADPALRPWLSVAGAVTMGVSIWVLIAGPMLMRREVHLMMERLDVIKSHPLRGWQVVLGEMLAPIVLLTSVEWLVLAVAAVSFGALTGKFATTALLTSLGAAGVGLLVPPVVGLMVAIPFAATLYFPGWMSAVGQAGGGMEVMGQRLIFAGGYLLVLVLALLPAALAAAVPYLVVQWLAGTQVPALLAGAVAASLVLIGELAAVVWWLGGRYERFDLSTELPQG
jgi:ABC-2 type transport system permease protein